MSKSSQTQFGIRSWEFGVGARLFRIPHSAFRTGTGVFRPCKGQSALEYVILIIMMIFAVVGLQTYLSYASAGRIKSASDNLNAILVDSDGGEVAFEDCRLTTDQTQTVGAGPTARFGQHTSSLEETQWQFSALGQAPIPQLPKCAWEP